MANQQQRIGEKFMNMVETFNRIRLNYVRTVPYKQKQDNYPASKEGEDYLITHLKHWVYDKIIKDINDGDVVSYLTRTKSHPHYGISYDPDKKDINKTLPTTIQNAIEALLPAPTWTGKAPTSINNDRGGKVAVTWVVCYINNILPDQQRPRWQFFECSHRCINRYYLSANGWDGGDFGRLPNPMCCVTAECLCWESKSYNQSRGNDFCCRPCSHPECDLTICDCQTIHYPPCL